MRDKYNARKTNNYLANNLSKAQSITLHTWQDTQIEAKSCNTSILLIS
jgi:hypothetical protein